MSTLNVDKVDPSTGTALEIGTSGDTINVPSGVTLDINSGATLDATGATVTGTIGRVLQVVQGSINTEASTTNGSFVTTGLSVDITPSSSSNKVLVLFNGVGGTNDTDGNYFTLYRDSTNLGGGSGHVRMKGVSGGFQSGISMSELDSPSTASQISYVVRFAQAGGTATISTGDTKSTITAMEIAV